MGHDPTALKRQRSIVETSERSLGRSLTEVETRFIKPRGGYLGLESICDHAALLVTEQDALACYLASESE